MIDTTVRRIAQPRQARAIATREALLQAVESIVETEGVEAVTTTRVAQEGGAAVGTIYRYFADREAMLLAAYDATVIRVVESCRAALVDLTEDLPVEQAAMRLLDVYLTSAETIPAHAGLLGAVRRLMPSEAGRARASDDIASELIVPFFVRFVPSARMDPIRVQLVTTVLSAMVDLYLVTPGTAERRALRAELDAYMIFMIGRIAAP